MKVNPGICSSYVFSRKPGDKITISGPYGEFFLPDDLPDTQELVFIGGGAGMAPMRSHIMHLFKTEKTKRPVSFWYGARALKEVPYSTEFHEIEKDFPNFSFHLALDRPDPEADAAGVKYTPGLRPQRAVRELPEKPSGAGGLHLPDVRASNDVGLGGQDARRPGRAARKYPLRQLRFVIRFVGIRIPGQLSGDFFVLRNGPFAGTAFREFYYICSNNRFTNLKPNSIEMNIPSIFWFIPAAAVIALLLRLGVLPCDEARGRRHAAHARDRRARAPGRHGLPAPAVQGRRASSSWCWRCFSPIWPTAPGCRTRWVPFAFLTGGFFSGLAGYFGMKTATYASARTANAARQSLDRGLKVAFRSGAVMGLVVVGLGLLDISFWYVILNHFVEVAGPQKLVVITTTMLTFGMGASTQALFARVGGGIYTKAADVGADLVGKVEAGIPEDDPRNPATIADNVGDNVGDVAGMGADLYESYCGSILATAALGRGGLRLGRPRRCRSRP